MQSISPGGVETEIAEASALASGGELSAELKKFMASIPLLKSKDVADSVVYVLSTPPRVQVHELIIKPIGEIV